MKLVIFTTENCIYITKPKLEDKCIAEMQECGVVDWDRTVVKNPISIQIETNTHFIITE